jgi:hypothetical protein
VKNLRALLLLCAGLLFAGIVVAGEAGPDLLTPAERAWLAQYQTLCWTSARNGRRRSSKTRIRWVFCRYSNPWIWRNSPLIWNRIRS